MFKQQKGITLIALVITIIVLLILAGITIAMLTGSDSAPAKANEAKQKNDIGAAKDQVYLFVQDEQANAYVSSYVEAGSTKSEAGTAVGTYVQGKVAAKNWTKVGDANIKSSSDGKKVSIWTKDYEVTGTIADDGATLTWSTYATPAATH